MWNFVVILANGLVLAGVVAGVTTTGQPDRLNSSVLLPRSGHIQNVGNGHRHDETERRSFSEGPVEWTMSKANLVAEFFTSEPAPSSQAQKNNLGERSQKSFFSFFGNNPKNGSGGVHNVKRSNNEKDPLIRGHQQQPPPRNLIASGSNFNGQTALPYPPEVNRISTSNNGNGFRFPSLGSGYSTPFRPIVKFPQQNFVLPPGASESGYAKNLRPPRGPPPPPPPQQFYGAPQQPMQRPINGLRPPPGLSMNPPPPPPALYLPPQHGNQPQIQSQLAPQPQQQQQSPSPQQRPTGMLTLPNQEPPPPRQQPPQQSYHQTQPQYPPPSPQNSSVFAPSQEYLPQQRPEMNHQPPPQQQQQQPQFRPGPPPPQILDNYRNHAVYPAPAPPLQTDNKPLVYVMANASDPMMQPQPFPPQTRPPPQANHQSHTMYENEFITPPHPYHPPEQRNPSSPQPPQQAPPSNPSPPQHSPPQHSPPQHSPPNLNLNELALTEPLSQVLADANSKAGGNMDKTIRFVIHKPEDEDIVRNAILEDSQNRYEDVRFVQGPTLKVQRKETVYLPPKRKTVVYILLKEPQIDTDVQVMTPQDEEPAPEVYITYQKSDGAVKTKHYSPKPIRQEDMKKYLDIEEDSAYGHPEESRLHPRFSKSTSVSLSTSSKVSRTTASTSKSSLASTEVMDVNDHPNNTSSYLNNHKMSANDSNHLAPNESIQLIKTSPLLYSSFTSSSGSISSSNNKNSSNDGGDDGALNSLINYRAKKGRSSSSSSSLSSLARGGPVFVPPPSPRRVLRTPPVQCPTIT